MKQGFAVYVFAFCLLAAAAMPHEQKDMEDEYNRIEMEPVKRGGTECGWGRGGCPPMLLCIDGYCKRPKW